MHKTRIKHNKNKNKDLYWKSKKKKTALDQHAWLHWHSETHTSLLNVRATCQVPWELQQITFFFYLLKFDIQLHSIYIFFAYSPISLKRIPFLVISTSLRKWQQTSLIKLFPLRICTLRPPFLVFKNYEIFIIFYSLQ